MEVIKKTTYLVKDFELTFEPIKDSIKIEKTKKGYTIKYLVYDNNPFNPFEDDGLGNFYHWKDFGQEQLEKYCELLGYDSETREKIKEDDLLAVRIDKYEHSGVSYSVKGEGTQCKWDTSNSWAVWYPDNCLLEMLKEIKNKNAQRKKAIEYARQACELHNQWANGEAYIIVKETFNKEKKNIDYDNIGGYFGYESSLKALENEI